MLDLLLFFFELTPDLFNDLGNYNQRNNDNRKMEGPDELEMQVLDDWKKRDAEMDNKLEDLNILLEEIKMQAEEQNAVSILLSFRLTPSKLRW